MKRLSMQIASCFIMLFLCIVSGQAQQFKWVKGGGTTQDFSASPSNMWERTEYMCTDANGNIYALSNVGTNPIFADTFHRASGAYGANQNILLTSYNCNGQMRWAKLLANNAFGALPFGIAADNLGNIYVAGWFNTDGGVLHIGYDTTISPPASDYLMTSLIQFDTSGHFKWIRFVGPNTFAAGSAINAGYAPLAIDGANNAHLFPDIKTGVALTPSVTSIYGVYDMTYNTAGTLLSAVRLDLDSQWFLHGAVIDPATSKLYVYGTQNQLSFGILDTFYAAAFDASRNQLWQHFCGHGNDDALTGIVLDPSKHLYFSGAAQPPVLPYTTRFIFNHDSILAPGFFDLSIIMRTDTNGNVGWIKHYDGTNDNAFDGITLLTPDLLGLAGSFGEKVIYDGDTINAGVGDDPFFSVIDTGGNLLALKSIHGDGVYDWGLAITSDGKGNMYIGGAVTDSIPNIIIPAYHTVGGNTDFFVIKYGVDCSCTAGPIASYTDTGTSTIGVTYTGTTLGLDSVVWNFGDGSHATGITALHTYITSGTYHVCVIVYTTCGSDIHCSDITVTCGGLPPVASFSDTGTHTVGFTFTGTGTIIDSIVWHYGDGHTGTGTTALHTYSVSGTYHACVYIYTNCGMDSSCSNVTIHIPTEVSPVYFKGEVRVFPNPANDALNITGVQENTFYQLLNITGISVSEGSLLQSTNMISMKDFALGVYILELSSENGERNIVRVIKK